ncbi:uncharacterized protein K460DRAFT_257994, partial [Cucurbitaria berberidis CBS 394.84]
PMDSAPEHKFATVTVGGDKKCFVVHEHLLTHYSSFFRAAYTGRHREAEDKTVTLENTTPKVFEFFVHWLYYERFPVRSLNDDMGLLEEWEREENDLPSTWWFVDLYIFGNKYEVHQLKIDVLNELFHLLEHESKSRLPGLDVVQEAFDLLPTDSPMCGFLVEAYCYWANPETLEEFGVFSCMPFLKAVWCRMCQLNQKGLKPQKNYKIDICDFHEHSTDEEKEACRKQR